MHQIQREQQPFILTAGQFILRNRWLVLVLGFLMAVLVEAIEHWPNFSALDGHSFSEIFFFGIAGPFVVWVMLTMLAKALTIDVPIDQIQAEATEAERKRLARDLHDKLAQNLGYLHFKLDQLAASGEATLTDIESIQTDLEKMRQIADQTYEQVRGTLDSLRDQTKTSDNLTIALRQQAQAIARRTNLDVKIDCPGGFGPLCPIINRTIIDIAREAIINVDKHAEASCVTISLACKDSDTFLTIIDNGKGFDQSALTPGHHYGLDIMRERAEEVGGRFQVKSTLGQGTQLKIQFPHAVISKSLLLKCKHLNCQSECPHENTSR